MFGWNILLLLKPLTPYLYTQNDITGWGIHMHMYAYIS